MKGDKEQPAISTNRSMPSAMIIPELAYPDVAAAVKWLSRVFGFSERLRIGSHRAQLVYGLGSIIVTKYATSNELDQSETPRPGQELFSHAVMVRVLDVQNHYQHAVKSGARILQPPADYPYGERQYTAEDLAGHRWIFSQSITDVDPATWGGVLL